MFTWVDVQERINIIFDTSRIQKMDTVLEKDKNGWNWILTFHRIETETTKILHTKFIFKLDEDKKKLRASHFLYLFDLNCKYHVIRFNDLTDMDTKIRRILLQPNQYFGHNLQALNDFIVSPAQAVNNYLYKKNVTDLSIFAFDYAPEEVIVPCQKLELPFKFNIDNRYDVMLVIKKVKDEKFNLTFDYQSETETVALDDLTNLVGAVGEYIKRTLK
jgi:hypothetical protein